MSQSVGPVSTEGTVVATAVLSLSTVFHLETKPSEYVLCFSPILNTSSWWNCTSACKVRFLVAFAICLLFLLHWSGYNRVDNQPTQKPCLHWDFVQELRMKLPSQQGWGQVVSHNVTFRFLWGFYLGIVFEGHFSHFNSCTSIHLPNWLD